MKARFRKILEKVLFHRAREILLEFEVDVDESGNQLVRIFLLLGEQKELIRDPAEITTLASFAGTFQRNGTRYIISFESLEILDSLLAQEPEITPEGVLMFRMRPSVLKYLRKQQNMNELGNSRKFRIVDSPLKPAVLIDFDPGRGLEVNSGFTHPEKEVLNVTPGDRIRKISENIAVNIPENTAEENESMDQAFVPAGEITRTEDGMYAIFDKTFVPVPEKDETSHWDLGSTAANGSQDILKKNSICVGLENIPEFFTRDLVLLETDHTAILTDRASKIEILDIGFRPCVNVHSDEPGWLDFEITYGDDRYRLPPGVIFDNEKEYHQVDENVWLRIDNEKIEEVNARLEELGVMETGTGFRIPITRFTSLEDFIIEIGGEREVNEAYLDFLETITHFSADPHFRLPEQLETQLKTNGIDLRPYQREGIQWLSWIIDHYLHGLLADDMGLGKTIQTAVVMGLHYHKQRERHYREEREEEGNPEGLVKEEKGQEGREEGKEQGKEEGNPEGVVDEGKGEGNLEGVVDDGRGLEGKIREIPKQDHSLVIAPKSVVPHWTRELERCIPEMNIYEYTGQDRSIDDFLDKRPTIVISTYATIRRDIHKIAAIPFEFLVLDEATRIKNPSAKRTRAIKTINASHRICLSGTPIENRPLELWSIFDFLMRGHLGSHADFLRFFEEPIERGEPEAFKRLSRRIRPFILRRLKGDVERDLPDKIELNEFCDLTEEQASIYMQIQETRIVPIRNAIQKGEKVSFTTNILPILTKLKQVCDHPGLVSGVLEPIMGRSRKFDMIIRKVNEIIRGNDHCVIFSHYLGMLDLLEKAMKERNIPFMRIDGSTNNRQHYFDDFNDGKYSVGLLSIQACGHGVTLTAANHVIHADRWWNPAVEDQATDRVHRIGQEKSVFVHTITTIGTIEGKIATLLHRKKDISDDIIDPATQGKMEWTRDELIELLRPLEWKPMDKDSKVETSGMEANG